MLDLSVGAVLWKGLRNLPLLTPKGFKGASCTICFEGQKIHIDSDIHLIIVYLSQTPGDFPLCTRCTLQKLRRLWIVLECFRLSKVMNNKMFSDVVPRVPWPKSSRSGWEEGLGDGEFDVSTNKEEQHCIRLHSKEFIYIKRTVKIQGKHLKKSKQYRCFYLKQKIGEKSDAEERYTYIYALDRCIEGTFGAFGQPAVGWLTEAWCFCFFWNPAKNPLKEGSQRKSSGSS